MKPTAILAIGAAMALSACGGGGGNPGATGSTPAQTLSAVTAANAPGVASNAYDATMAISESSTELTGLLTGVSVGGARIGVVAPVLTLVRRAGHAPRLLAGVTMSENCAGGGSVTIDATVRSQDVISNGDRMTITARNCVEDGTTMNGAMSIGFSNMSGDILNSAVYGATMDTRFTNFTIASGADSIGVNGDMKLVINQTGIRANTVAISGKSLQLTEQQGGAAMNATLGDYALTGSTQGATTSSAASFTLSGSSAGLGQFAYTVKNLQPFALTSGSAVPASGALIVNGAASSVTATVVGNGVRLDYSAKGDGTVTQSNTLSWTQFLSAM